MIRQYNLKKRIAHQTGKGDIVEKRQTFINIIIFTTSSIKVFPNRKAVRERNLL
jgi:hypothetical protein